MADEHSPLLQNEQAHESDIVYSAVNELEGSTDAEQQLTVVAAAYYHCQFDSVVAELRRTQL